MRNNSIREMVMAGLFIAMGLVIPPMFPVLPYMFFELIVYAAGVNVLSRKLKL